jgi:DNA-binding transcriptional LysR family regulator
MVPEMPRDIEVGLLRAFVAVSDTGGMTSAGRLLNLTQAAVSQQVKRLEDLLQLTLFDRSQRQIRLTENGERLLAYANRIISLNDEVWGFMTSPHFEGEVRLGVPDDIINVYMPPILRAFKHSWPRVNISLTSKTTPELLELLNNNEIDLTLTTEQTPGSPEQLLLADPLVWVGAHDGEAHKTNPLPVAFGSEKCVFRSAAVKVLTQDGRDWQFICQSSNMAPLYATLEADMAVAPFMARSVPEHLKILGDDCNLPELPTFYVNLCLPQAGVNDIAAEFAKIIRENFRSRFPMAA